MTIIRINTNSTVIIDRLKKNAIIAGFKIINEGESKTVIRIETDDDLKLDEWILSESLENNPEIDIIYNRITAPFKPYFTKNQIHNNLINPQNPKLSPNITPKLTYFNAKQIASIYGFSQPQPNIVNVIGIISFGGGLFGTVDANGILTNGDIQAYWASIGISPTSYPVVKLVLVDNVNNLPIQNDGATIENTIDVQMVGTCCASASTIIILYIAPNSDLGFLDVITTVLNVPINVNGTFVKPTTISISWGAPEIYYSNSLRNNLNSLFQSATNAGINIFVASGDNGSSDGIVGTLNVDYPASSSYVIGCGGTNLVCPNISYDNLTVETVWSGSGRGFSKIFSIPSYQTSLNLSQNFRAVPDIAGVADPNTGVLFRIGGSSYIIGGTSIVAPAYAGFIASLNLNYFILPRIYTYTSLSFHDVVIGNNGEYSGKVGYDNGTGLGSLNGNVIGPLLITQNIIPPVLPIIVTGITLNVTTLSLNPTQTSQLTPTITPTNASNKNITWTSSNTNVATVSNIGLVRAIGNGNTTIRATTVDQSKVASVAVSVITPVTGITLNVTTLSLNPNQTSQLISTISPTNASNKNITWSSSNTNVATVSGTGLVRAIGNGNATIRATTVDQSKVASVTVSVITPITSVTGITLNITTLLLNPTQTSQLIPTISPANASNKNITWTSSNTNVATVSDTGLVRAIGNGNAIIRATTVDQSKVATVYVTVITPVIGITLNVPTIRIQLNLTGQIIPIITPTTASNKSIVWSSSNTQICTVNTSGVIRGVTRGSAIVTARTVNGGKIASVTVTIF
jgi:uncharacterized protein YjdB